jgi:hypothetical protein
LRCISVCEKYGFTRSKTDGNNCTLLNFTAELVGFSEEIPINIKDFNYIAANITFCTAFEYTHEWSFNLESTIEANNGKYICLYAEDANGNSTTLRSTSTIHVDTTAPVCTW